jgi:glutamate N-acetyltransferase / amino-acid N-acetyltransferase
MVPPLHPQVDGDTSTNDCVLALASGSSGAPLIADPASPEAAQLEAALTALLQVCEQGT